MKVLNVEEVAPTKKKLTLQIEPGDLATEREDAYTELGKEAAIPGFRKGHVPRQFLEYRFDKTIRKEAFGEAVDKALRDAAKENELQAVGQPVFDEVDLESLADKAVEEPVEIGVTLEVIPPFDLPAYQGVKFSVPDPGITDDMIARELERQREDAAYYLAVDDRPSKKGDFLVIDAQATRDGKEFAPFTSNRMMVSNLGHDEGAKGFDEGLLNLRKGEKFEFDFEVSKDHPMFEADGVNTFHVTGKVHQISERQLPEADDEFAKDKGFTDLEAFRKAIRRSMEGGRDAFVRRAKEEKVREYLLEKTELTVPSSLIQSTYVSMKYARMRREAESGEGNRYLSASQKSKLEMDTMFLAEEATKERLLLLKVAEKEGLSIGDDEYYDAMSAVAQRRGEKNLDKFLAEIDKHGLEDSYKEDLLIDKATRWLLDHNEFELTGSGAEAEGHVHGPGCGHDHD
jgi:trigger factor